jgi:hypothetical protein
MVSGGVHRGRAEGGRHAAERKAVGDGKLKRKANETAAWRKSEVGDWEVSSMSLQDRPVAPHQVLTFFRETNNKQFECSDIFAAIIAPPPL